jgi:type II secretion system (T2SS) protein E
VPAPRPKKFGQILLERGWITKDQLQRALQNQSVVGGRIGTCLLEMDALPEDLVMKALSEQHNVPAATVEDLRNVPEDVITLLPARVARRCRAVPFQISGTQVSIALLDVRNLQIQDELAFVTAKRLKIFVANEARVFEALEKYYGEECPQRFSHLIDRMNRARYLWDRADETRAPAATQSERHSTEAAAAGRYGTQPAVTPPPAPPSRRSTLTIPLAPEERAALAGTSSPAPVTSGDVELRLLNPKDRDDVGHGLLAYLGQAFNRALLFKAVKNNVEGWMGTGAGVELEALRNTSIPLNQPSVFLNLKQGSNFYLGPLAPLPAHRDLARAWGGELPKECLVLPVRIKDRMAMFIYLDKGAEGLAGVDVDSLHRLAAKVAIAFELCIMRSKLKQA